MLNSSSRALRSARTREALLTRSQTLFAQRGFANTTVDDVARAAGLTKGALYWHFSSKDDLLQAILDSIRQRWHAVVVEPTARQPDPLKRLGALFDSYQQLFIESPDICLFLQQVFLDHHNTLGSKRIATVYTQTAGFIARIFEDGKRSGVFSGDVDSTVAGHVVLGMLSGVTQQVRAQPSLTLRSALRVARSMAIAYAMSPRNRQASGRQKRAVHQRRARSA